jgi:hypothetical protein
MKARACAITNMATTTLKKTLILKEDQLFFFKTKEYFHLCKREELEKLHAHFKVLPLTIILVEPPQASEDVVHIIIGQGRDCNLDLRNHTNND